MLSLVLATVYAGRIGQPLYCSTPDAPRYYDTAYSPWLALPIEHYQDGRVQCGDLLYLRFPDGSTLMARAYDAGPFASYCVRQADGSCPSIGLDVPEHLWPVEDLSAFVEMYNISAAHRASRNAPDRSPPQAVGGNPGGGM